MKVRVKEGGQGFIYGLLRKEGQEFTLKPVEHSTQKDKKGDPLIVTAEDQFSDNWMEKVGGSSESKVPDTDALKAPAKMNVKELTAALNEAKVNIPEGSKKPELVKLLEDFQSSEE